MEIGFRNLRDILNSESFRSDEYASELSTNSDGLSDLLRVRNGIGALNDETSVSLKKNVYKNYRQFIDTSKDISYLETEIYQLNHLLNEEKAIVSGLLEFSVVDDDQATVGKEIIDEDDEEQLRNLLDSLEGDIDVEVTPKTRILRQEILLELNPDTYQAVRNVFVSLLSDRIIISTAIPRGTTQTSRKYKLEGNYLLNSLAVVDVTGGAGIKNAFKILPQLFLFQARSKEGKLAWIKGINDAQEKLEPDTSNTVAAPVSSEFDIALNISQGASTNNEVIPVEEAKPMFEDLDICVAQRDFEGAAKFIIKIHEIIQHHKVEEVKEYKDRLDEITIELSSNLAQELTSFYGSSLPGGNSTVRKAVDVLKQLGRTSLACQLFMKNRSYATRYKLRQLKIEGAITLYITKLSRTFFSEMQKTATEFRLSFADKPTCFSTFIVWAKAEIKAFVSSFSRQVFQNNLSLSLVSDCVRVACTQCDALKAVGLDLKFILHRVMLSSILEVIFDARDQLLDACKHRIVEEQWRSINLRKEEPALALCKEMNSYGLELFNKYVYNGCVIQLSDAILSFVKGIMSFLEGCFQFDISELNGVIVDCVSDVFKAQIQHTKATLSSKQFNTERPFILKNVDFLASSLLPCIKQRVKAKFGYSFSQFEQLESMLMSIASANRQTTPTKVKLSYPSLKSMQISNVDKEFDFDEAEFV